MLVLIDNGHGEETPGKRSPKWKNGTQLFEWKYTREIAAEVVRQLRLQRIDARLLVPENNDISLGERCRRVNRLCDAVGKQNVFLCSIHCNASAEGKATGWEIHTYTGQNISDVRAKAIWETAKVILTGVTNMRGDWSDGEPDWDSNFAILRDTNCSSVLTENLFMDNEKDCKFLLSDNGKKAIVDIHVQGIIKAINLV